MPVHVRYIVNDVDAAIAFYTTALGFKVDMHPAPGFARISRGDLRLLLNRPGAGGAGQPMPGGQQPVPGGSEALELMKRNFGRTIDPNGNYRGASTNRGVSHDVPIFPGPGAHIPW